MSLSFQKTLIHAAVLAAAFALASRSDAAGQIDAETLVATPLDTFNGVEYTRYEAMFEGVTPNNRPYRVPCQIIAPAEPSDGSGLLLFDWLVRSTVFTIVGQEQADARYTMTDRFLFGLGLSYATVRCDPLCIGKSSPDSDPTRPWSDNLLDTSSEFIVSAGDEFDIVVDYVKALRTDPVALALLGQINRRAGIRLFRVGWPTPGPFAPEDGGGAVRLLARGGKRRRLQSSHGE